MKSFDDLMFDRLFQPGSEKFQVLTGRNCFWLAKWSVVFAAILFVTSNFFYFRIGIMSLSFVVVMDGLFLPSVPCLLLASRAQEVECLKTPGLKNKNRVNVLLMTLRTAFVLLTVGEFMFLLGGTFAGVLSGSSVFFYTCYLYFSACTPLPPQKSSLRKWLESRKRQRVFQAVTSTT